MVGRNTRIIYLIKGSITKNIQCCHVNVVAGKCGVNFKLLYAPLCSFSPFSFPTLTAVWPVAPRITVRHCSRPCSAICRGTFPVLDRVVGCVPHMLFPPRRLGFKFRVKPNVKVDFFLNSTYLDQMSRTKKCQVT